VNSEIAIIRRTAANTSVQGTVGSVVLSLLCSQVMVLPDRGGGSVSRDGKNHDFFKKIENIEKIENIGYFRYISDFFDIYPIHI